MSTEPTPDPVRVSIKRLIESEILACVNEWYEGRGPGIPGLLRRFGEAGLLGLNAPKVCGGQGLDFSSQLLLAEELGHIKCAGPVSALAVQAQFATAALAHQTSDDVQNEFLAPAIAGHQVAGRQRCRPSAALARDDAVHARRCGGDFLLFGTALKVENARDSDWMNLNCADLDAASNVPRALRVLVPSRLPGVSISATTAEAAALCGISFVTLDAVRVPMRYLVRPGAPAEDRRLRDQDRLFAATLYLSRIEDLVTITADYLCSSDRRAGPAVSAQFLVASLAELQSEVVCARALIGLAARELPRNEGAATLAAMARYKVGQLGRTVPNVCLKIWGKPPRDEDDLISQMREDMNRFALDGSTQQALLRDIARDLGFAAPGPVPGPRRSRALH